MQTIDPKALLRKFWLVLAVLAVPLTSGCAAALGAGAVVGADAVAESDGDDGLI